MKTLDQFTDEIPLMIDRAKRRRGISQAELAELLDYTPQYLSGIVNGKGIEGMPLGKLMILMDLAECSYEWRKH